MVNFTTAAYSSLVAIYKTTCLHCSIEKALIKNCSQETNCPGCISY